MPWYYAQNNQRFGPYTEQEFAGLVAQGTVAPDTLVWRDGMQNWLPFGQVSYQAPPSGGATPDYGMSDKAMVVCSSCHRTFPEDEVIQYQGSYICANCKPSFVQQLREGVYAGGPMDFGGFWIRFAARFIDGLIVGGVFTVLLLLIINTQSMETNQVAQAFINLASFLTQIVYETFFLGRFGATPGKMACGLRVVKANGENISYLRAFARFWAMQLSSLICLIGYIIAAFDSEKRALHDHICGTRVIRK